MDRPGVDIEAFKRVADVCNEEGKLARRYRWLAGDELSLGREPDDSEVPSQRPPGVRFLP